MLCKVTRCAGRVSANTRPHQLRWGDREMGTAISCTECSQVAGLIQKSVETPRKHRLFVQLFFVQLSFVRRSYVAIDRHVLFCMHKVFSAIMQHSVDTAQASATLLFATGLNITTLLDHILSV